MSKADLHRLVDELPEAKAEEARLLLEELRDAPSYTAETAPFDDEPLTDDDRAALDEAHEDIRAGRVTTQEEVERKLGL